MKSEDEVQRAHDLLVGIIRKDIPAQFSDPADDAAMRSAADMLCWLLEHDHNTTFQENLAKIEAALFAKGLVLLRDGEPPPDISQI